MIKIAICDDELYFRESIRIFLEDYLNMYQLKSEITLYESGKEFIADVMNKKNWELVFLDIEMPEIDGIEIGETIRRMAPRIGIIFVTSHNTYVREAFSLGAFQYLEKPLTKEIFEEEMNRFLKTYQRKQYKYTVKWQGEETQLAPREIIYLETERRKVIIHTKDKTYPMVSKMDDEEEKLKLYYFLRIHRAFLVNMDYIVGFKTSEVEVKCGRESVFLAVSKERSKTVRQAYVEYKNRVGI